MNNNKPSLLRFDDSSSFLYLDFETYNLNLHGDYNAPWQAGLIKVKGSKILASEEILFNWNGKFSMRKDNPSFNHYSERTIQEKGVKPIDALNRIVQLIDESDYLIGHNFLKFDIFILKELYRMFRKDDYKNIIPKIIDTKTLALAIKLNINKAADESLTEFQFRFLNFYKKGVKTNLIQLCKEYGISIDETMSHSAVYDLQKNLEVFNKQKYQLDI